VKHFCLVLFLTGLLRADAIGVGIRLGTPLTHFFDSAIQLRNPIQGENRRLIAGPTLELRLPAGLGMSFDILRRGYRFRSQDGSFSAGGSNWEFPMMARYRFPGIAARPFISGGPVWSRFSQLGDTSTASGLVFGTGVDIKIPLLHLTPEIRYQHRFLDNRPLLSLPNSNQFDLMLGISF
jgi:hypothetical protein